MELRLLGEQMIYVATIEDGDMELELEFALTEHGLVYIKQGWDMRTGERLLPTECVRTESMYGNELKELVSKYGGQKW